MMRINKGNTEIFMVLPGKDSGVRTKAKAKVK
jgi:hypothetical protein